MTDPLTCAARRLGIPTHRSAGPGHYPYGQIWATWPRHQLEVAHDVLDEVRVLEREAAVVPDHGSGKWRAHFRDWSYVGTFTDAVGMLALRVARRRRAFLR